MSRPRSAGIAIRPLRLDERADWEPLWKGYLDFYKTSVPQQTYDTTWARLHDPDEPMWLLGATVDGKLLGIVHYLYLFGSRRIGQVRIEHLVYMPLELYFFRINYVLLFFFCHAHAFILLGHTFYHS